MAFVWHLVIIIGTWLPGALTYTMIFGKGKILHFGPLGVSLVTAYATFLVLGATGSYPLAILTGLGSAVCISAVFAWLSLRLEPDGFGIMSIAVHLSILSIVLNWSSLTRGALGIPRLPRAPFPASQEGFALTMVAMCILWVLGMWLLDRSSFGRQLAALAEHEWHSAALGVSRARVHFFAFMVGALGSLFGTLPYHHYIGLLHPNDYQFPGLIFFVMLVVAGKPGSVLGVTLSTILLVLLKELLRFVPLPPDILGPMRLILFGVILFVAVWVRRDTLFPKQRTV
ncbi:MAG: branched-chain amino acid transport system permease protein [Candidatus Peregrinibacteria bacterium Greene0416_62]|nr:MAG: branched-chain amino acid transport system permease protein [Candidatus Peregrinibacteria bacterium Greene0416_62]TSC99141.1 MAG: branched-chain amino acid transport system permease protein [Candidatus Peregrinibacteria bacterium Greene1014_49]